MDLVQNGQVVVGVHMEQTAGDIAVQLIQVGCQIAAFFKIQSTLQTQHNAASTGNGF